MTWLCSSSDTFCMLPAGFVVFYVFFLFWEEFSIMLPSGLSYLQMKLLSKENCIHIQLQSQMNWNFALLLWLLLMLQCCSRYKSFIEFTFVTWQADYKLSYALKHCNQQHEANIRFNSGVSTVCIAFSWSELSFRLH